MTTGVTEEKALITAAPYVSFPSFTNLLEWLAAVGIPLQMDRSFWGQKFSGAVGGQLMSALRFFDLLDQDIPTAKLAELVKADTESRKRLFGDLLKEKYAAIFALGDLHRVTPKQILDTLEREYRVTGDTTRKAQSFFINGCKYADIPLSTTLRKTARIRKAGRPRQRAQGQGSQPAAPPADNGKTSSSYSYSEVVQLPNGAGNVALVVSFNPFKLSPSDRAFVFDLVDKLNAYKVQGADPPSGGYPTEEQQGADD